MTRERMHVLYNYSVPASTKPTWPIVRSPRARLSRRERRVLFALVETYIGRTDWTTREAATSPKTRRLPRWCNECRFLRRDEKTRVYSARY